SSLAGPGRAARGGLDGAAWLTKPVLPWELRAALLALHERGPTAGAEADAECGRPPGTAARRLRILGAQDNPINQVLRGDPLWKLGHAAVVAGSGAEALAARERQPFDALLVDVQMPGMSGLELTARVRERERATGARLPVLAVTAHAVPGDRERCL